MNMLNLKIKSVTVLLHEGTDRITLELDAPSPFPAMKYKASATVEAEQGYGVEWSRLVFGVEPKIIDARGDRASSSRKAPR